MGPFVPDIISDQLNLVVALFLGFGFGFVLEQAGFSSSRRLAGLFYGYDFTVLRVFFTAAVTAMSGSLLLAYFGLLDLDAIFVNPTWLMPAIVGGLIMGVGFLLGGYCPGTSLCAMMIGKIDAMFFVGGGILGIFLFGEFYPLYQTFYDSTSLGAIKVYSSIGISQGLFAFLLIAMAVGAFVVTTIIEKKVNPQSTAFAFPKRFHLYAGVFAVLLGLILFLLPDRKAHMIDVVSNPSYIASHPVKSMSIDELAFRIVDKEPNFRIVDIRPTNEFANVALPNSNNFGMIDFFNKEWVSLFSQRHVKKVIVGNDEQEERAAALLLQRLGYDNIVYLEGGYSAFEKTIFDPSSIQATGSRWDGDVQRFHTEARMTIQKMITDAKNKPEKSAKVVKKIKGGC